MKNLSRRMKRMLAILLVETIVAVNVISSYASDADGVMTFSEEEVSEMAENASSTSEGGSSDSEPAAEESSYEEPAYEEPVEETPQEEEPQTEEPQETPAEQEESGTDDPVAEEPSLTNEDAASEETVEEIPEEQQPEEAAEEASECTCEKSCGASEYDAECPICRAVADMDESEREAFLKDHCSKYEEVTEEEKDDITEPEIINKESNITITGTSVADGAAIEGASDFTISVSGEVTLSDKAPAIEGYEFNGRIYLKESGSEISAVKKETVENKETEDDVVVKIIKETTVSVYDVEAADWKALEADTVVVFEYTALEDEEEDTDENSVQFYAACVDEDGNAIEGYEKQRLTVADALDLTKAPITIEGYEYVEATVDGTVVLSVEKSVAEDAVDEDGTVYSYTTSDGSVEVSEDTTVTLTYQAVEEVKEVVLSWNYVDEDGNAIEGVEGEPEFEDTLVLDDAEKAPVAVEGYEYVEASIDGTVLTSITKETEQTEEADAEPVVTYSYTTTSGESVAIEEDTEITLNYEETGIAVKVDATVVDEFGDEIDEKYTNMELPEFTDGVLVLDDVENPPVAKVQVRKSLFKVIKYTYVQATIDGKIVTGLKREATKETADFAEKEQEFIYSYSTDGASWTKLTEDTTVIFEYTDGKKTVFTYEDSKVQVTATLQHAGAVPDDAELVVTEITSGQAYDAYMEALNASDADKEYSEQNTLLYDIGFVATDEETGETVEVEPTEGSVKISIVFKQNQLSEDLSAAASEEVEIKHLPLADGVKESAGTTLDAENISASDVKVESVSNQVVNVDSGVAEFVTDSFSVYSVSSKPAIDVEKIDMDIMGILSAHGAFGYGIVANTYDQSGDTETNVMVGSYHSNVADVGASKNYSNAGGNNYFGSVSSVEAIRFHQAPANVYLGHKATQQYESGEFQFTADSTVGTVIHTDYEIDVAGIVTGVGASVNSAVSGNQASDLGNAGNDKYLLDLRDYPAGTYVVNYSGTTMISDQNFDIWLNSNQRLVINCTADSVHIQRYHLNGHQPSDYVGSKDEGADYMTQAVVFNCPNATSITLEETMGIIIAPNADVTRSGGACGGILICNATTANNEWHYHDHDLPAPGDAELSLEVTKTYNQPLTAEQFSFTLKDGEGNVVGTAKNDANGNVKFEKISYSAEGTYYYTITEDIPEGAVSNTDGTKTYDNVIYENSVITAAVTVELNTALNKYTVTSISYTKADGNGQSVIEGTSMIRNEEIETIEISGTKTWDDNNNQDGKRPASITINLLADGTKVKEQTVMADGNGNWSYRFTDLPKSANGQDIVYTITEEAVEGYTATVDGYNVTNSHNPGTVDIFGEKVWDDSNDQDGSRPDSVTIKLWINDKETDKTTVATIDNNWKWSFDNLPEYANGQKIAYTVTEEAVDGYEFVGITEDKEKGFVITNKHTPETVDISGEKVWNDNDNQDGARPDSITVKLWADGKDTGKTTTTTAGQEWKWSFTDLAKYKNVNGKGVEIQYTVTEDAVEGYTTSSITKDAEKGFVITNTHTPEKTEISVTKKWDDNDDQDGVRPDSIKVTLKANGEKATVKDAEVTLNAENNWTYTWTNLDAKINGGKSVVYTVSEEKNKYYTTVEIKKLTQGSFEITNSRTPDKTSRTVVKNWDDNNNQDGVRPSEIKVILKANGEKATVKDAEVTLNAENGWTYTWKDLDLKAGKKEITYTVEEVIADEKTREAYPNSSCEYDKGTHTFTITNKHTPATVFVEGSKEWNDNNNQDGVRPESITILLLANTGVNGSNVVVDSKEVTEAEGWTWRFDSLPKYANGQKIQYSVQEVLTGTDADNYTSENVSETFNIRNTHTPVKTKISGTKTWNDADNQDGIRPESITVKLYANGVDTGKTATASAATDWKYSFEKLDKFADGKEIKYTVVEVAVKGYEASYSTDGLDVTNTHTPETITVNGSKIWDDNNNQDGKRPTEITVILNANGTEKAREKVTADASGNWSFSFKDLPKYADGSEITYTVQEEIADKTARDAYTTKIDGYTITNSHVPEKTSISGTKTWDDANNQDRKRPDSITIKLLANGKDTGKTATATKDNSWTYSFENLNVYADGVKINYTVQEVAPEGYTEKYTTTDSGYDITNSYAPEKVNINGTKAWVDADNQDGIRPSSIVIKLYADGQYTGKYAKVTAENNWSWSFNGLDKNKDGQSITYTVTEDSVEGYTTAITGTAATGFAITNTHTPETVNISGTKVWADADNQDGVRPDSITVRLFADGTEVKQTTATAGNNWSWSFDNLAKYKNVDGEGIAIVYTISEDAIVKGEATVYEASITGDVENGFTITNTHTPETVNISGTKTWVDNDDQDGVRPNKIKVTLYADGKEVKSETVREKDNWSYSFSDLPKYKNVDGKGVEIQYTITEDAVEGYTTTYDGYDITNTHTPGKTSRTVTKVWNDQNNQDGARPTEITVQLYAGENAYSDPVVLNAANNWSHTWDNLPEKAQKKPITYTVKELGAVATDGSIVEITGYTTACSDDTFTITNTHEPAKVYVEGKKIWEDHNNQDGVRPSSITIELYADGVLKDSKEVTEKDGWTWKFDQLPKYAAGKKISYSVKEVLSEADAKNYTAENISKTFDIKNTHTPVQTEISGTKTWNDANNQDGVRPSSITVKLLANGADTAKTATASAATGWKYTFTDLDKFADGKEIKYTVEEVEVDGYEVSYSTDGLDVTNTHIPEKTSVTIEKKWQDSYNQDGIRPSSITVRLHANGAEVASATVVPDVATGEWKYTFTDLDKFADGKAIKYTVTEDPVKGYDKPIYDGFTITNCHTPETTEIKGSKVWSDGDNQDGKRPDSVTVRLLADGSDTGKSVEVSEKTNWTFSFTDLPKYKDGTEINYTVAEDAVSNYTTTISDDVKTAITITNSYTPGKTSVSGSKTWEDGNDQDGKRPEKITINLLADDAKVDSKTVTADDNWSWSFTDLPEYQNGQKITYTISEETVTGYTPSIDGYNVTNTHIPEKISVSGNKTWEDGNNQDGKRPVSITITLLANKEPVATKEVTAADNWSWEFTGLDKYKNGKEIGYSVVETLSEEAAAAYTVEYQDGTFNVINKHTPEKVNISGTKVWNDADDQDGVRPSSVTITLLADGKEKDSKTVSSADNWKWTFENLDKYADGKLINYTITEEKVDNYSTVIETAGDYAYTVTNSYTPGKTSMTVVKSWNDGKDQDGIRPSEIKVVLLADGKAANVADAEVTLNASNGWTYTWNGLDLKSKGSTIRYTVQEISEIEGYETSYTNKDGVITITNIHTPDEVYVEGTKTWNDANNQDGVRPAEIKINLLADGVLKESKIVSAEDNWSWKFDKLPKNKVDENGKSVMIQYSITEDAVTGYETTYPDKTFNVENTHTPEKTSISGFKKWEDNNNQDGVRPDSITVTLCADGVATDKTAIVTAADNWKFSFTDLPKYAEGKQGQVINYTVKEADVDGYMANITGNATEGYTITNTHNPEKINVSGEKIWSDNNNQDGLRPDSIKVYLYADGKELTDKTATVTASTDGKWNFTFENLDKFINGKEVTYTVKEEVVSGYTVSITGNTAEGYTITNTHTPETIAISGSKTWNDENNKYLSRPESITVNLLADGEVKESKVINEADGWKYSFTNLPKYKYENGQGGVLITYTISEEKVEGYSTAYNGYDITNSYTPEKTSKTVTKIWKDGENQDGLRQDSITVVLLANSETAKAVGVADAEVTLNASNNWTYTWNDLPVEYNKKDVVYTVQEISKIAGYDTTYTNSGDTVTITNTHTPALTEISGAKTWVDEKNQDGLRPEKITIRLWADGQLKESKDVTANDNWAWSFKDLPKNKAGKEIVYTITEDTVDGYTTEVDGYNVTNTHTPVLIEIGGTKTWNDEDNKYLGRPESITVYLLADGKVIDTKEVTDALGWTYSFTDLPKYAVGQQGHEIVYTIQEEAVTDYSTKYDGFDIANDYTPGETAKTVTKIWDDEDDQDGLRPTEIKVVLLANGETADAVGVMSAEVTLSATNEWTYTWTDLPVKYNKKDVTYTVKELGAVAADGSIVEITGYTTAYSEDTFTITNTHEPAEVYVEGVKTWEDGDNQDGIRPTEITIKLLADGEVADRMVVTPDAEGKWSWKFDHLPKFANGDEIQYSIEEIKVEGYESKPDYTDGKFNLINTHKPETVELSGSKTWNDANDQDGVRPSSITIHLLADGVEIDSKTVTAADNWSWTFEDLPKNKNVDGVVSPIEYTITEDAVDGYTAAYTDDGMSVVNSYTPEKTGRNVVKIWDDGNNADRIRPAYIEVQLYADGEAYGDAVVLNDANGWSYAWTDLQAKKGGQYIVYTVQEITNVSGYTTTVTESGTTFTIVNYHPVTPPPTPTPTPPTTPPSTPPDVTPTPTTPSITPPPEVPTPTPDDNEVLGARRGGAVLGARRGLDQAVLGKRRRPTTGDSAALIAWMITLFGAMGAATVSVIGLRKKEEEK